MYLDEERMPAAREQVLLGNEKSVLLELALLFRKCKLKHSGLEIISL